jgi:hypothetical protein
MSCETHPEIPPNDDRFYLDWKGRAVFLIRADQVLDCAEYKTERQAVLIEEIKDFWVQRDCRNEARIAWIDRGNAVRDAIERRGHDDPVRPQDQNAWSEHEECYRNEEAWRIWGLKK